MGQPATATPPRNPSPQATQVASPAAPGSDLTFNKVLAVAGAGATSAVLGSLFGVAGTVLGAAIGAVLSTMATSLYQRSLDRARTAVTSRVRPRNVDEQATVIISRSARPGDQTELIAPADVEARSRRRAVGYVLATVLGFTIALALVTGIEALKGSTLLRGEAGTSVGRVLNNGGAPAPADTTTTSDDEPAGNDTTEPTPEPTTRPSATTGPSPTTEPSSTPKPAPTGGLGELLGGSNGGTGGTGQGANR